MSASDNLNPQQFAAHRAADPGKEKVSLRDRLGIPHLEAKHRGDAKTYDYFGEHGITPDTQ